MAELSAPPPTGPLAADASAAPPVPKSSLYGDKALVANPVVLRARPDPDNTRKPARENLPPPLAEENHVRQETVAASNSPESAPSLYPNVRVTASSENADVPTEQPQIAPLSDYVPAKMAKDDANEPARPLQVVQEVAAGVKSPNPIARTAPESLESAPSLYQSIQVTPSLENTDVSTKQPQIAPRPVKAEGASELPPPLQVVQDVAVKDETPNPIAPNAQTSPEVAVKEESPDPIAPNAQTSPEVAAQVESPDRISAPKPAAETEGGATVPIINEPEAGSSPPGLPAALPPYPPAASVVVAPRQPAPDTLSYLESASMMSGTMESLTGIGEDGSSIGSDSEINGLAVRRTDKYGFLGGNQYSDGGDKDVRVEVSRQREMKWLDMFNHWDKWAKHRFQKVKMRCRKGIPSSLRSKAWQLLSDSQELLQNNPGKFEELEREPGEAKWLDIIEKDLHRQFPFHEMFAARGGHGQQDLFRILKAYTIYRPDEGYCQAQAPVAAVLLMHMPAEQAFWCLVQICEKYLPGYYSAGLEAIQLDGEIFFSLLRRTCPMAYRHLKKFKIDPILYMTEWFMCIFSRTLPWSSVLRVWDMFFCEGVKIVFRVGLVLLKQMLGSVDKLREVQGMYETMERLRNIAPDMIREEVLVQEIVTLPVTEALIERECSVQVRKWRESRGELTHEPGRRLHGTRHIFEQKRRASSLASGGSFSFLSSSVPPPGPLRASSSLLSLPGFRRSKTPFHTQPKKASFSGPSRAQSPPQSPPASGQMSSNKPPLPPPKSSHVQSPLATSWTNQESPKTEAGDRQNELQVNALQPSPKIVSEQITPQIPSPTANNAPLPPCPVETKRETTAAAQKPEQSATADEPKKGGKKAKDDKKKEKEDERKRLKEKRDKEKAEKERLKREKERQERERKRSGKKKQHGGASAAGGASEEGGGAKDIA
ncbi:TBC1 domain family member 10B [Eucyclogobius newberryi]|uniref:TBC1 domain family member 10B n=1 Tax=Eucyclogobius newberryi TaxID=166745 RepID=UPI003B592F85